jgi:uncharacterized protein YbjT (DUF2867 family)
MILVTGASGTVGTEVVRALVHRGVGFRAGVHARPLGVRGVESVTVDYDRPETLPAALQGVRTLFLLSPEVTHERAMVAAAMRAGVERIVKLSAWKADEEEFAVGRAHREVERQIEASGMAWTFLRPNTFLQNFVTYVGQGIRRHNAFADSVGDARVSHIDARDVGQVAAQVLTEPGHEGRAYLLSGSEAVTHEEVAGTLTLALGRPIKFIRVDDDGYRKALAREGLPAEDVEALVDISRYIRTGAGSTITQTVQELTGRPATPLEQFCRDYASALGAGVAPDVRSPHAGP